ncbi:N-acetyltransferase family protein [Shewanella sp.]|uniref:GNAT family N-acetyltransferase n=1 Tax=Shewanella sp. TaxID=50422 RepID=UPI003D13AC99
MDQESELLIRQASAADLAAITALEASQWQAELAPEQRGELMSGQQFSAQSLSDLISDHYIVVAQHKGKIVGYVIAGSWAFFAAWPIYRRLLKNLTDHSLAGQPLSVDNSCQYGPIWIAPSYRGAGLFADMVAKLKALVKPQYSFMLTFIAEDNERSFAAHTHKAEMQVLDFFDFDDRGYYLLATSTQADSSSCAGGQK